MSRALFALLAPLALTSAACSDYSVTQGGAQDFNLGRGHIEAGLIPDQSAITAEGLFSEHDLPLTDASGCDALLCPATAVAATDPVDGSGPQLLVQLGFNTGVGEGFERRPLNAVAVVDVSGSMGGAKLRLAKESLHLLVDQLTEDDTLSLVTFGNRAKVERAPQQMSSWQRQRMHSAIDGLRTRGSTSVEAGLTEGFAQLHRNSGEPGVSDRVFVLTDARPNVDATDADSFVAMARDEADLGVGVSLIGVGDDLGADLAVKMSTVRGGLFHFIADEADAQQVFVDELAFNVTPLAFDLEVRVEAAEGVAFGEGFAAPLDQAAEAVDFGASTLFLSARSGGMGVSLIPTRELDLGALARFDLSFTDVDGGQHQSSLSVGFEGGQAWQTEATQADALGVFKMAALVDELHALRGAAAWCDGELELIEALARVDAASERLESAAEAIGGDAGLEEERALLGLLSETLAAGEATRCVSGQ